MTIIKPGRSPKRSGPSFRKALYVAEARGILYAAKWPRTRGKSPHPNVRHNQDWFKEAQAAQKVTAPRVIVTAMEATHGTPLLPRDLLTAAMAGRLFAITEAGRGTLFPVAARQDVSQSLDIIGQKHGDILVRRDDIWSVLPQGNPGQILVSQGPGALPVWSQFIDQEQDIMITSGGTTVAAGGLLALWGNRFVPAVTVFPSHIWVKLTAVDTATYRAHIVRMDGNDIAEILASSPTVVAVGSTVQVFVFPLPANVIMIAGGNYAALLVRTDGTPTDPGKVYVGDEALAGFPSLFQTGTYSGAFNPAAVGDTLTFNGLENPRVIHLIYTL